MINMDCVVSEVEKKNRVETEYSANGNRSKTHMWGGEVRLTLVCNEAKITVKVFADQFVMLGDVYSVKIEKKEATK